MVLELARLRAVDRPVPAVVHARRELVREEVAPGLEELDGQHADVAELVEQPRRYLLGLALWGIRRRRARHGQDPAAMLVLRHRIERGLAGASAHRDDRQLALEGDDPLRQFVLVERPVRLDDALSLAVVAEAA